MAAVVTTFGGTSSSMVVPRAVAAGDNSSDAAASSSSTTFRTRAYGQQEYTNSIAASRDTNISPAEAYDVIRQYIPKASTFSSSSSSSSSSLRRAALDVGAGAGVSTAVLYHELGYRTIDAVDWSGDAWRENVIQVPESVRWFELDDDAFFLAQQQQQQQQQLDTNNNNQQQQRMNYTIIVYNFAINPSKAVRIAKQYLTDDGVLLAPVNDKSDYWYKQTYWVLNKQGILMAKSNPDVGAWSVQFQPDVTSETCTGIWCGSFNGFNNNKNKK